jgi:hypothetical protein
MGGSRTAGRRKPRSEVKSIPTAEIAAGLISAIQRDGAILKTEVAKRSSRTQLLEVFDALVRAGFEISARFVRRALETQLLERLDGAPVPLRGLDKLLRGATAREITEAATSLVDRGRARLVARGKDMLIARPDAAVFDARARQRLKATVQALAASLVLAERKGASVLKADVDDALRPFVGLAAPVATTSLHDVAALVDAHREGSGLTSVPKLVRMMGGASMRETVHAELLRGARAGRFELRPESGMGRLSAEDASFCIPGPQGSRLSWVRRIEGEP